MSSPPAVMARLYTVYPKTVRGFMTPHQSSNSNQRAGLPFCACGLQSQDLQASSTVSVQRVPLPVHDDASKAGQDCLHTKTLNSELDGNSMRPGTCDG